MLDGGSKTEAVPLIQNTAMINGHFSFPSLICRGVPAFRAGSMAPQQNAKAKPQMHPGRNAEATWSVVRCHISWNQIKLQAGVHAGFLFRPDWTRVSASEAWFSGGKICGIIQWNPMACTAIKLIENVAQPAAGAGLRERKRKPQHILPHTLSLYCMREMSCGCLTEPRSFRPRGWRHSLHNYSQQWRTLRRRPECDK